MQYIWHHDPRLMEMRRIAEYVELFQLRKGSTHGLV